MKDEGRGKGKRMSGIEKKGGGVFFRKKKGACIRHVNRAERCYAMERHVTVQYHEHA